MLINQKQFYENLLLTQMYCEIQLQNKCKHIAAALRTYNPEINGKRLFSYGYGATNGYLKEQYTTILAFDPIRGDDNKFYDNIFEKQLEHKTDVVNTGTQKNNYQGRIFVSELDVTVFDGASEAESEGLIDINDCPPIDTWFYLTQNETGRVLYAWIPECFIQVANEAIAVNCVDCIAWADDLYKRDVTNIDHSPNILYFLKKLFSFFRNNGVKKH